MIRHFILAAAMAATPTIPVHADWIRDMTIDACSDEARSRIAESTRGQIESSVRRSEAAIEPPASIGDLGCIDGLMDVELDWFAPVGGLADLLSGSLDGVVGNGADARKICRHAERKWRQITQPLTQPLNLLNLGLPPDFAGTFGQSPERDDSPSTTVISDRNDARGGRESSTSLQDGYRQNSQGVADSDSVNEDRVDDNPIDAIWNSLYGTGGSR